MQPQIGVLWSSSFLVETTGQKQQINISVHHTTCGSLTIFVGAVVVMIKW